MIRSVVLSMSVAMLLAACSAGDPEPDDTAASQATPSTPATPLGARPASFAQCATCHAVDAGKNGIGPSLAGVFGAKAGHVGDYAYSSALRGSGLVWDEATLDAYLAQPMTKVPGTKMSYGGMRDADQRAAIIAYLKTL